jgi:hypothetical protein
VHDRESADTEGGYRPLESLTHRGRNSPRYLVGVFFNLCTGWELMVADSRLAGRKFGDLEERKKGLVRENRPGFQMNVANQKEGYPAKRDGIQKKFCFFGSLWV